MYTGIVIGLTLFGLFIWDIGRNSPYAGKYVSEFILTLISGIVVFTMTVAFLIIGYGIARLFK